VESDDSFNGRSFLFLSASLSPQLILSLHFQCNAADIGAAGGIFRCVIHGHPGNIQQAEREGNGNDETNETYFDHSDRNFWAPIFSWDRNTCFMNSRFCVWFSQFAVQRPDALDLVPGAAAAPESYQYQNLPKATPFQGLQGNKRTFALCQPRNL
jgi:hypothetical protein